MGTSRRAVNRIVDNVGKSARKVMTRPGKRVLDEATRTVLASSAGHHGIAPDNSRGAHTHTPRLHSHEDSYDTSPAVTRAGDGSDAAEHPLSRVEIDEGPEVESREEDVGRRARNGR